MTKEYWTVSEVVEIFQIPRTFLMILEEEDIICSRCREEDNERIYCREEMEMLRIAKMLTEEFDVNLPGVDIILHMRRQLMDMRKQFDEILLDLSEKLRTRL
jgi:MerR family transcriptional regulator/heat shock protein HspR